MVEKVLQLKCYCNEYPWGKKGRQGLAATFCEKTPGTDFVAKDDTPYSEMWMGTYPDLPSYVLSTGENLQNVLDKHPDEFLGPSVTKKFGHTHIPYLPKVLSIAKALPLQLHPDKILASKLHSENPSQFTDPNHKPEVGLALTEFEAFCGFKPLADIEHLLNLPPLQQFFPESKVSNFDDQSLKHVVKSMLLASADTISKVNDELLKLPKETFGKDAYVQDMIPRLVEQYDKSDNGIIVALITMNYMKLQPGECVYVPADGIHAWLSGDIIECMARSNNVLNTGFCPRADRDSVDLFTQVLTFHPHDPKEALLAAKDFKRGKHGQTKIYSPPLSEFSVLAIVIETHGRETIDKLGGPSVAIVTRGGGSLKADGKQYELEEGYIFFIGHGVAMDFQSTKGLQIFVAFTE